MKNKRKGMELKSIWFKRSEYNKLIHCIEGNYKEQAFDIIFEMRRRGDI